MLKHQKEKGSSASSLTAVIGFVKFRSYHQIQCHTITKTSDAIGNSMKTMNLCFYCKRIVTAVVKRQFLVPE